MGLVERAGWARVRRTERADRRERRLGTCTGKDSGGGQVTVGGGTQVNGSVHHYWLELTVGSIFPMGTGLKPTAE